MSWYFRRLSWSCVLLVLLCCIPAHAGSATTQATGAKVYAVTPDVSVLDVEFDAKPTFTARLSHNRTRLTIDVLGSKVGSSAPPVLTPEAGTIAGVMIQGFAQPRPTTRVLVTFRDEKPYSVHVEGNTLKVRVGEVAGRTPKPRLPTAGDATSAEATALIEDIAFHERSSAQEVKVVVSARAEYRAHRPTATLSRLTLTGVRVPQDLERTLDVKAFDGVLESVSTYRSGANDVVVEAQHHSSAQSRVTLDGTTLVWSFYEGKVPSMVSGVAADGKAARRTKSVAAEIPLLDTEAGSGSSVESQSFDQAASFMTPVLGQQRGRYSGRRIDMDFKDADVHNVLRLLADTGRVNIVAADNVSGAVTIRMRNVPWDQALDVVLQAKNLGMDRRGNIIRVAPQADLEREREMAIARRKQELQLAPLETRLIPVSYAEAAELQVRARELLSGRGSVSVDERTNVMIVRDVAGNLDQVEELTRSLDTQTPQVLIEARIVEATSRYLHEVGVQWGGDASFSAATGNPTGLSFPSSVGLTGGASDTEAPTAGLSPFQTDVENPNFAVNLPAAVGAGAGGALGLTLGSVDGNFNLALRLSAAETSGMLRILSSPRVLTLDNREARISQGTLIPFSQVSAQGVQTTFQEAKLQLLVRPHVTADGSVSMHVKINRDEPDFNQTSPRGDPTILKREAETELLVMDGHTAVIGGIFTRNTGRSVDQVPFFGDIPLLGLLFQHRSSSDTRGELVIFLTPRIVNRAEALGR